MQHRHKFLNGVCRHEPTTRAKTETVQFLNGVCRHEPPVQEVHVTSAFLNGVCRHEHGPNLFGQDAGFLNGVCRHERLDLGLYHGVDGVDVHGDIRHLEKSCV